MSPNNGYEVDYSLCALKRTTFENRCIMHCKPLNKFKLCMPMDCVSGDV